MLSSRDRNCASALCQWRLGLVQPLFLSNIDFATVAQTVSSCGRSSSRLLATCNSTVYLLVKSVIASPFLGVPLTRYQCGGGVSIDGTLVSAPDVLQVLSAPALTASPRSAMREGISDREGALMGNRTKDLTGIVSAGAERPVEQRPSSQAPKLLEPRPTGLVF